MITCYNKIHYSIPSPFWPCLALLCKGCYGCPAITPGPCGVREHSVAMLLCSGCSIPCVQKGPAKDTNPSVGKEKTERKSPNGSLSRNLYGDQLQQAVAGASRQP